MIEEPGRKRAERYLLMATENASRAARCADAAEMETYLHLASVWLKLAEEAAAEWTPQARPANTHGPSEDPEALRA